MRDHVAALIKKQSGMKVLSGPFTGMKVADIDTWADGTICPKLLGTYEEEIHPTLLEFMKKNYNAIAIIGCAEGYYATGLAILFPNIPIYAFDIDLDYKHAVETNARLNNIHKQVEFCGPCSPEILKKIAQENNRILVFCDCEGYETTLLADEHLLYSLARSDLIVECHDFCSPNATAIVYANLRHTHVPQIIDSGGRNPNRFPFLAHLNELDRWLAVLEARPCVMSWVIASSRSISLSQSDIIRING